MSACHCALPGGARARSGCTCARAWGHYMHVLPSPVSRSAAVTRRPMPTWSLTCRHALCVAGVLHRAGAHQRAGRGGRPNLVPVWHGSPFQCVHMLGAWRTMCDRGSRARCSFVGSTTPAPDHVLFTSASQAASCFDALGWHNTGDCGFGTSHCSPGSYSVGSACEDKEIQVGTQPSPR